MIGNIQRLNFGTLIIATIFLHSTIGKQTSLTKNEKAAVDKLRSSVLNKLTVEYMKSDTYIIKWLQAKNFNHEQAKQAFEKTLAWRKEINADNLPFEDFSNLKTGYVIDFSTSRDKFGSPVVLIPFQHWNLRRKALAGTVVSELGRYLDYLEEKSAQMAYNLTGDPTSFLIIDMHGFNLRQHACVGCTPFYLNWVVHHETHYPYSFSKLYLINTPSIFDPIFTLMRPLMTKSTRDAFRTFGYDRAEWSANLFKTVDPKELPVRFGGTKKRLTMN